MQQKETSINVDTASENISYVELSTYLDAYEGSFGFHYLRNDRWCIYDLEHATLRVAPNSTYKIYVALLGLEEDIITPENAFISWNGENYPFEHGIQTSPCNQQ